jgi:hypothetical protein
MLPLKSIYITSPYGWRIHPVLKVERFHHGVDLRAHYTSVYAVASGVVESAKWMGVYGNAIKINHGEFTSFYAHLKSLYVKAGDNITEGQAIALSGNTGTLTTAPHLHFGIYVNGESTDPLKYLEGLMEKAKVKSSYFGTEYDARLIDGKTFVELKLFANDHHIPVTRWEPDTKTATVGGGLIENLADLADSLKKGVK